MSCMTLGCMPVTGKVCHCAACHRTFGSVSGFDLHRRAGVCVDPATITGQRLDENGIWRYPPKDRDAPSPWSRRAQAAETGLGVLRPRVDDSEPADSRTAGTACERCQRPATPHAVCPPGTCASCNTVMPYADLTRIELADGEIDDDPDLLACADVYACQVRAGEIDPDDVPRSHAGNPAT